MSEKIKTHYCGYLMTVNAENILPRDCLAHEIPVLKIIKGEFNVNVIDGKENVAPGPEGSARDIFASAKKKYAKYRSPDGENPVDIAFPDGSRDIEAFYRGEYTFNSMLDEGESFSEEQNEDDATANPHVHSADDRQQIIQQLEAQGIEYNKHTPTAALKSLLDSVELGE